LFIRFIGVLTLFSAHTVLAETPLEAAFPEADIIATCQLENGVAAVAAAAPGTSGAYYAVVPGEEPTKLENFVGDADLVCYSPEEAAGINRVINQSEGMTGGISPVGSGTVICGFLSSVETQCWQFDNDGNLKRVGGWET